MPNKHIAKLTRERDELKNDLDQAQNKIRRLTVENLSQKSMINSMKIKLDKRSKDENHLYRSIVTSKFTYGNIRSSENKFFYLSGLTVLKFDMIWDILSPYAHCIKYPDCVGTGRRSLDKATELFSCVVYLSSCSSSGCYGTYVEHWYQHDASCFCWMDCFP